MSRNLNFRPKFPLCGRQPSNPKPTKRQLKRRTLTDRKISAGVLEVAREKGIEAVTIENVAKVSGVAKTTIYRRYVNRDEMVLDVGRRLALPTFTGELPYSKEGVIEFIKRTQAVLADRIGLGAVSSFLTTNDDPTKTLRQEIVNPQIDSFCEYIDEGIRRGIFREVNSRLIVEMIIGALVLHYSLNEEIPDDFIDQLIETIWPMVAK